MSQIFKIRLAMIKILLFLLNFGFTMFITDENVFYVLDVIFLTFLLCKKLTSSRSMWNKRQLNIESNFLSGEKHWLYFSFPDFMFLLHLHLGSFSPILYLLLNYSLTIFKASTILSCLSSKYFNKWVSLIIIALEALRNLLIYLI